MKKLFAKLGGACRSLYTGAGKGLRRAFNASRTPKWRHGSLGMAVLAALIVAGVFINIAVQSLEDTYGWRRDFSFNGYTVTGEQTQAVVDSLPAEVEIFLLYQSGDMDSQLYEVLMRYHRLSDKITVTPMDIAKNPGLLTRFQGELTQTLETDSVIVNCDATQRYKILNYEDFVTQGYNIEQGTFEIAGLAYEKSVTEALVYVTQAQLPTIGVLQGHGELTLDAMQNLTDFLRRNNYEVTTVDLLVSGSLSEVDMLLIAGPQKDLTTQELEAVQSFAQEGGSLFVIRNYTDPVTLPNYMSLLKNYGVTPIPGVVVAGEEDSGSYYGERIYLLPYFTQMEMTQPLIAASMDVLLLAGASAFETPAQTDNALSAATVLKTGANAYVKNPENGADSIDFEEGDRKGELTLAILSGRMHAGGTVSRMFAIGNSTVFTDEYMYQRTFNEEFILQVMGELMPQKSVSLDIIAKSAFHPGMRAGSQTVGVMLLTALPLLTLVAAALVLLPRRNR